MGQSLENQRVVDAMQVSIQKCLRSAFGGMHPGGTLDGRMVGGDHKQKASEMEYIYIASGIKLRPHTNNKRQSINTIKPYVR